MKSDLFAYFASLDNVWEPAESISEVSHRRPLEHYLDFLIGVVGVSAREVFDFVVQFNKGYISWHVSNEDSLGTFADHERLLPQYFLWPIRSGERSF